MTILPCAGAVTVRPVTQAETTSGGVHVPQTSRKLLDEGVILHVGSGVSEWKAGDRVVYSRYSGTWVKLAVDGAGAFSSDGENVLIIDAEDLRARIAEA